MGNISVEEVLISIVEFAKSVDARDKKIENLESELRRKEYLINSTTERARKAERDTKELQARLDAVIEETPSTGTNSALETEKLRARIRKGAKVLLDHHCNPEAHSDLDTRGKLTEILGVFGPKPAGENL